MKTLMLGFFFLVVTPDTVKAVGSFAHNADCMSAAASVQALHRDWTVIFQYPEGFVTFNPPPEACFEGTPVN